KAFVRESGHEDVFPSVVVHVPEVRSHTGNGSAVRVIRHPGGQRDFFKPPVSEVMKQEIRNGVVGDENVGKAVAIVVGEGDTHALAAMGADSAGRGDILVGTVAAIAI